MHCRMAGDCLSALTHIHPWRAAKRQRTIHSMHLRGGWPRVVVPALIVIAATSVPYVLATVLQPKGYVFGGFLLNPIDGFSYLAKMRQGAGGAWLFHLPYAAQPGGGAFLFVYYLFLGHLGRLLHLPALTTFHLARGLGALAMYGTGAAFLGRFLPLGEGRRWAWQAILFGSGWGWLGIPAGLLALDLWVPEAVPFLSAYASAHFALSMAVVWLAGLCIFPGMESRRRFVVAAACGAALSLLQPFAVAVLGLVSAIWLAIEALAKPASGDPVSIRAAISALAAFALGAAPVLVYDVWAVTANPSLAGWNSQNLTPSPSLLETALAFLPLLALAVPALWNRVSWKNPAVRFLVVWGATNLVLLYAPFGLQRRLVLGLYLPLAVLAGMGVFALTGWRKWLPTALLLLTLPSHLVVVGAGLAAALTQDPKLVPTVEEVAAYRWMEASLPEGALVLAGARAGNRIPAFADVRVLYGHPFETPSAAIEHAWVEAVYAWRGGAVELLEALRARGVAYVYVGIEERGLGPLDWLSSLAPEFQSGEVAVYSLPGR